MSPLNFLNMDGSLLRIGGDDYHHYIDKVRPWRDWERVSTAFHRPITPREELAAFMFNRSICESANLRFDDAMESCKTAARLQPDNHAYVNEQSIIHQNHANRRKRQSVKFSPFFGQYSEIVTAFGCFSSKPINT